MIDFANLTDLNLLIMHKSFPRKFSFFILLILVFFTSPLVANVDLVQQDSTENKQITSTEELVRGERLFHGLVYLENKSSNCASCHNVAFSDTLNWNPNAIEISQKYLNKTADDLARVILKPAGKKMAESHSGIKLSPQEIAMIKVYMDTLPEKGLKKDKPVITNLLLFIIASIAFLVSFTDLIITKKIKKQWIHVAILTLTLSFLTYMMVINGIALGRSPGYSPDQPIKFSHKIHAGQNGTDCIYCHSYAPYSKVAGIPSGNVCMNCHLLVRTGNRSGAFEIAKVTDSFENKAPVKWNQVYNLPDHVYYNHSQHVNAGGLDCTECHGDVKQMDRIEIVRELSMGWCIDCHRTRNVNFDENEFYRQYTLLTEEKNKGIIDSVTVARQGGTECMRCHY